MQNNQLIYYFLLVILISYCLTQKTQSGFDLHSNKNDVDLSKIKNNKKQRINDQKEQFQIKGFLGSLRELGNQIQTFFVNLYNYFILRKTKSIQKQSVIYRQNFASQTGGAQILMVSSSKIVSPKAILRNDPDAYLFTADVLPITIVIGLQQQILIDSFSIQSGQVYSCITQDFALQGAFSLQNEEWLHLGNFTADNNFQTQQFAVQQNIIRYIRLTITSSYGNWKYFTLSQIKVYGQGLFSHAMQNLLQSQLNVNKTTSIVNSTKDNIKRAQNHKIQEHHKTKKLFTEAFQELVVHDLQNQKKNNNMNSNQQASNPSQITDTSYQQQKQEQQTPKSKKSISNLKKKISYLQKRNFELHNDLKQLKHTTRQKIQQLQTKYVDNQISKNHKDSFVGLSLFDPNIIIAWSLIINIFCIGLFVYVFKFKLSQNQNDRSQNKKTGSQGNKASGQAQFQSQGNKNKPLSQKIQQQEKKGQQVTKQLFQNLFQPRSETQKQEDKNQQNNLSNSQASKSNKSNKQKNN